MQNKMLLKDVVVRFPDVQVVNEEDCFFDAIKVLNTNRWGAVFVVNTAMKVQGIITDGDARKIMATNNEPLAQLNSEPTSKYANKSPTVFLESMSVVESLKIMNEKMFLCAPVVDSEGKFIGAVHIQHLLRELINNGTI